MEAKNIYAALAAINLDINPIEKGSRNTQQGFNFRSVEDVANHLHPIFAKHGVVILPRPVGELTREVIASKSGGSLYLSIQDWEFTFCSADGSTATATGKGESMDTLDKGVNKTHSAALKYVLTTMFLIPTKDSDPDAYTPDPAQKTTAKNAKQSSSAMPEDIKGQWLSMFNQCLTVEQLAAFARKEAEGIKGQPEVTAMYRARATELKVK